MKSAVTNSIIQPSTDRRMLHPLRDHGVEKSMFSVSAHPERLMTQEVRKKKLRPLMHSFVSKWLTFDLIPLLSFTKCPWFASNCALNNQLKIDRTEREIALEGN